MTATAPQLMFASMLSAECRLETDFNLDATQQLIRNGSRLAQGLFALTYDTNREGADRECASRIARRLQRENLSRIKESALRTPHPADYQDRLRILDSRNLLVDEEFVDRRIEDEWRLSRSRLEDQLQLFAKASREIRSPDEATQKCCMASRDIQCDLVLMFAMARWGPVWRINFGEFKQLFQHAIDILNAGLNSLQSVERMSSESRRFIDNMQLRLKYLQKLFSSLYQSGDDLTEVIDELVASAKRGWVAAE